MFEKKKVLFETSECSFLYDDVTTNCSFVIIVLVQSFSSNGLTPAVALFGTSECSFLYDHVTTNCSFFITVPILSFSLDGLTPIVSSFIGLVWDHDLSPHVVVDEQRYGNRDT